MANLQPKYQKFYVATTERQMEAVLHATDLYMREYDQRYKPPKFMTEDLRCLHRLLTEMKEQYSLKITPLPTGGTNGDNINSGTLR